MKKIQVYRINDGKCYVCGGMTNSLSARPSEWAIYLAHIDGQKQHRYYHTKCLYPILKAEQEIDREEILKILDSQYGITLREGTEFSEGVIKALADNVADALVGKVKADSSPVLCPSTHGTDYKVNA